MSSKLSVFIIFQFCQNGNNNLDFGEIKFNSYQFVGKKFAKLLYRLPKYKNYKCSNDLTFCRFNFDKGETIHIFFEENKDTSQFIGKDARRWSMDILKPLIISRINIFDFSYKYSKKEEKEFRKTYQWLKQNRGFKGTFSDLKKDIVQSYIWSGHSFTKETLKHVKYCYGKRTITLSDRNFLNKDLRLISGLKNIDVITIEDIKHLTDDGLKHIRPLKKLGQIELSNVNITDKGLIHLQDLPNLGLLNLKNTKINGEGFTYLRNSKSLISLNLTGDSINDKTLKNLKYLSNSLINLSINESNITDKGIKFIEKLPKLGTIYLCDNPKLTDKTITFLLKLKNINLMNVGHHKQFPKKIIKELKNSKKYFPASCDFR